MMSLLITSGKQIFLILMFFHVFSFSSVSGQKLQHERFSDQSLQKFVEINQEVKKIEHAFENDMIEAIKAEHLEVGRFNELLKAQQNNDLKNTDASSEEIAAFNSVIQQVQAIQQTMSEEITMHVEQEMGIEKYKSIMHAYEHSPAVRDRINSILYY